MSDLIPRIAREAITDAKDDDCPEGITIAYFSVKPTKDDQEILVLHIHRAGGAVQTESWYTNGHEDWWVIVRHPPTIECYLDIDYILSNTLIGINPRVEEASAFFTWDI